MSDENPLASLSHERGEFRAIAGGLEWTGRGETLRIQAWGRDSLRVRSKVGGPVLDGLPGALLDEPVGGPGPAAVAAQIDGGARARAHHARVVNGAITAT